jgi:hypothetical protein
MEGSGAGGGAPNESMGDQKRESMGDEAMGKGGGGKMRDKMR